MTLINISQEQLEAAEKVITAYIEQLSVEIRESTYSKIMENRRKIAIEIQEILRGAK